MDEMNVKIKSGLMNNLISRLIRKTIYSKLGADLSVNTNNIHIITDNEGYIHYSLEVNGKMLYTELCKLIEKPNLSSSQDS